VVPHGAHRSLDDPGAPVRDDVEVEALLQILAPLAFTFATQPAGWTDLMPSDNLLNAIRSAGPAFTDLGRAAKTSCGSCRWVPVYWCPW
jgi:hypothetical protein